MQFGVEMLIKFIMLIFFAFAFSNCNSSRQIKFTVSENSPVKFELGAIGAKLSSSKKMLLHPLMRSPVDQYFLLDPNSGKLQLKQQIDREVICPESPKECILNFDVQESTNNNLMEVSVEITDINDNSPKFPMKKSLLKIKELSKIGTEFELPTATDKDSESNGIIKYRMISDKVNKNVERDFQFIVQTQLKTLQPKLKQIKLLDRETTSEYKFYLRAEDKDKYFGETLITLEVEDENDNFPQWIGLPYQVTVKECVEPFHHLIDISASDADQGGHGSISYKINLLADTFVENHFILDGTKLILSSNIDYENKLHRRVLVPVLAADAGGLTNSTKVEVKIEDCNDNSPVITVRNSHEKLSINENDDSDSNIVIIDVTDADSGENGHVNCELESVKEYFRLTLLTNANSDRGLFYQLVKNDGYSFDREKASTIKVDINCKDSGVPPRSTKQSLILIVNDVNDNEPQLISGFSFNIMENNKNGALVGKFEASDLDENESEAIEYTLVYEYYINTFSLSKDGYLYVNRKLDREYVSKYKIEIRLQDSKPPKRSSFYNITINVLDANDGIPVYTGERMFKITESNGESNSQVIIGQLNATDSDEGQNSDVEFILDSSKTLPITAKYFYRISKNGLLSARGNLDREKYTIHQLLIIIQDRGKRPKSTSVQITIHLTDINDNKPVFLFPSKKENFISITVDTSVKTTIGMLKAEDKDLKENGTVQFKCQSTSTYFSINKTGEIILEKSLGQPNGNFKHSHTINVQAYDLGNPSLQEYTRLFIYVTDNLVGATRERNEFSENPNNNENKNKIDKSGYQSSDKKQINIIIIMISFIMIIFFVLVAVLSFIFCRKKIFSLIGLFNRHRYTEEAGTNYTNQPLDKSIVIPNFAICSLKEVNPDGTICVGELNREIPQSSGLHYITIARPNPGQHRFPSYCKECKNQTHSNSVGYSHIQSLDELENNEKQFIPLMTSSPTNYFEFDQENITPQSAELPDYWLESQKRLVKVNSSFV